MISTFRILLLIGLLASTALQQSEVGQSDGNARVSLAQMEIDVLKEKVDLMKQKVAILEQQKRDLGAPSEASEESASYKESIQTLIANITASTLGKPLLESFQQTVIENRRGRVNVQVQLGERGLVQFESDDKPVDILDFMLMPVSPFLEIPGQPSSNQKEVVLAVLSDRSIAVSTIGGRSLLRFPIDQIWMQDEDDEIVATAIPPIAGDPFIAMLTKKGNLLIYHYGVVASVSEYKKHLTFMQSVFEDDVSWICKCDELCPGLKEMTPEQIDEEAEKYFQPFFVITNIEKVDLPFIIANETRVQTGPFDPEAGVEFTRLSLLQNTGQKYFVIGDSEGYLSSVIRNLMLKARFYSDDQDIVQLTTHSAFAMIVHSKSIAFSQMKDNRILNYYCEISASDDATTIVSAHSESYRTQQYYVYALNSNNEIVIFDANLSQKNEEAGCKQVSTVKLPDEFVGGGSIGIASLRGALFVQAEDGRIALLDTSLASLLQTSELKIISPKYMEEAAQTGAKVQSPIKVSEVKIADSLKNKAKNSRNSFIAVRVPGSSSQLAIFEHDTDTTIPSSQSNPALQSDWSGGGSIVGMVVLVGVVVSCMNAGGFKKGKGAASSGLGGSRGFGGRRK